MCRLFGLHAGARPVRATFWLLDAPDSLSVQSRREPDGAGIGTFDADGAAHVAKQPLAAWEDHAFAREARDLKSTTFLAHVRYASTGAHTMVNTHPFEQDGRLFAHNGAFGGLGRLDHHLAGLGATGLVHGQTDSERLFALITAESRRADGDAGEGITRAITWIAREVPVLSLNLIVTTATELWAVRYPATHELYILERGRADAAGPAPLDARSHRIHARSDDLAGSSHVLIATERMDQDPRWRALEAGELVHVGPDLAVTAGFPFPEAPTHPLTLSDLEPSAAASQKA
ncbi:MULTISPECIES: class II glutamine amidotransferase [unclassified Arthrobacter]|uniref:class II glutamine amidotransferase n=1 Tax=unclassified Arthrobacter TaxID=235627 RepID=UPI002DF7CAA9|nr:MULTISPECIES: class II glutamine amidotransferase [unclassified Arthrobacter]MEC5192938.1 putative glutamine amidotransferase [Arthrobacter sp. MP_M4]MEC5204467.1 putative glutamine amidotransferase [Arthrobacter sp. MP_M7]